MCILQEITVQLTKTENNALTIRYPQFPRSGFRLVLPPTDWVVPAKEVTAEGLGDDLAAPVEAAV